ncbi:MAG: peptidylprolyl isomerase [Microbacteriaceae bacterium]
MVNSDKVRRAQLREFQARQTLHHSVAARLRRDQYIWSFSAVAAIVLASLGLWAYGTIGAGAPPKAPDEELSEYREWTGNIVLGDTSLDISLDGAAAPQAVATVVSLINEGFYDATSCHRLTTGDMAVVQCGDPLGFGFGGPGYTFGPVENAPADDVYPAGTLAMARAAADGESMGSQFFIVYEDSVIPSDLAGGYTIIGKVSSSLDAFIEEFVTPGTVDGSPDGQPLAAIVIDSITIR